MAIKKENKFEKAVAEVDAQEAVAREKSEKVLKSIAGDNGKTKVVVDKCKKDKNITLVDFVKNISFHIDNYDAICKKYNNDNLYLEINAKDYNNNYKNYMIPLRITDNCNNKKVLD